MSEKHPTERETRNSGTTPDRVNIESQSSQLSGLKEIPCVWMTAKVVNFKLCRQGYDCLNCTFDKAMREAWSQLQQDDP